MEQPGIKTAAFFGLIAMSPFFLLGSPSANSLEARQAKRVAVEAEIDYRCAKPNMIEVTRYTGLGMRVYNCEDRRNDR